MLYVIISICRIIITTPNATNRWNVFFKLLFSISLYKLLFVINSFCTFAAHRPLFLFNAPQFYLRLLPPPWFVPAPPGGQYRPLWETLPGLKYSSTHINTTITRLNSYPDQTHQSMDSLTERHWNTVAINASIFQHVRYCYYVLVAILSSHALVAENVTSRSRHILLMSDGNLVLTLHLTLMATWYSRWIAIIIKRVCQY